MLVDLLSCTHQFQCNKNYLCIFSILFGSQGRNWCLLTRLDATFGVSFPEQGLGLIVQEKAPQNATISKVHFRIDLTFEPTVIQQMKDVKIHVHFKRIVAGAVNAFKKMMCLILPPKKQKQEETHVLSLKEVPQSKMNMLNLKWSYPKIKVPCPTNIKKTQQSPNVLNNKTVFHVCIATTRNIVLPGVFGQFMGFQLTRLSFLLDMDPGIVLCLEFQSDTIWGLISKASWPPKALGSYLFEKQNAHLSARFSEHQSIYEPWGGKNWLFGTLSGALSCLGYFLGRTSSLRRLIRMAWKPQVSSQSPVL